MTLSTVSSTTSRLSMMAHERADLLEVFERQIVVHEVDQLVGALVGASVRVFCEHVLVRLIHHRADLAGHVAAVLFKVGDAFLEAGDALARRLARAMV